MTINTFLTDRYNDIMLMSKRICKGSPEHEDVCHYVIENFIQHKRAQELVDKNEAMKFMSGMIHRSFHSSTSPYHKIYRQSGRVHQLYDKTVNKLNDSAFETEKGWHKRLSDYQNVFHKHDDVYDYESDLNLESAQGIMEDMLSDGVEQWFRVTLFKMWLEESNYSELSRITQIPRTSISQAVQECIAYIKSRVDNGINT